MLNATPMLKKQGLVKLDKPSYKNKLIGLNCILKKIKPMSLFLYEGLSNFIKPWFFLHRGCIELKLYNTAPIAQW